jgi:protein-export membrane protein SecD
MMKYRISALFLLVLAFLVGFFVYKTEINKESAYTFKLGLDLSGGSHLVYKADVSEIPKGEVDGAMESLRNVIERRINIFGVSEPVVQTEKGGVFGGGEERRLIVELPGISDVSKAIEMIGKTPTLEFKLLKEEVKNSNQGTLDKAAINEMFISTGLTGSFIKKAQLVFDQITGEPKVALNFNSEGSKLFEEITKANVGRVLAIFLDGEPISMPVIRQAISGGTAEISGGFNIKQAKELVRDLNYGALPMPIELVSTATIEATLGEAAVVAGVRAGIWAFVVIALFLILWYRLPGLLAAIALIFYVIINLVLFKLIPVTLTSAGIAGFILSVGMAVDANILIFERMKEELRRGKKLRESMEEGFRRAWFSIRDSNLSSMITAAILFFLASTNVVKGFALVFGIGVLTSMLSAITVSRILMRVVIFSESRFMRFLCSSGLRSIK